MMKERFYELWQFFGGTFHQDWKYDASDWQSAVRSSIEGSSPERIRAVATQLGVLLSMNLDAERLDAAIQELGCDWSPGGEMSDLEWLHRIHDMLREAVRALR